MLLRVREVWWMPFGVSVLNIYFLQNVEILTDETLVKSLLDILKTNVAACQGIGNGFLPQVR